MFESNLNKLIKSFSLLFFFPGFIKIVHYDERKVSQQIWAFFMYKHGGSGVQIHEYGLQLIRLNCVYTSKIWQGFLSCWNESEVWLSDFLKG